jgi:hypothetical protein
VGHSRLPIELCLFCGSHEYLSNKAKPNNQNINFKLGRKDDEWKLSQKGYSDWRDSPAISVDTRATSIGGKAGK